MNAGEKMAFPLSTHLNLLGTDLTPHSENRTTYRPILHNVNFVPLVTMESAIEKQRKIEGIIE